MSDQAAFYVAGGTIPPDCPSYVARAADRELLDALASGELCYVLNARQMGKSSLCVRTRAALGAAGTRTAFLDLQKFGSSGSAEQWYNSLLQRIGLDLRLRAEMLAYWRENGDRTPIDRLFGALRDVALAQIPGNIVVFFDEIDVVRDFSFKTDEFFGAIREMHNARADDASLSRLTFCIIGTVAPTDLIRDVRLSPFNIGTRIRLGDLTPAEAAPLAGPLPGGAKALDRILWWTNGHPYLTQRLCAERTLAGGTDVDAMVARLFFAKSDAEVDENIKNVRNAVLRMGGEGAGFDRTDLLTEYEAIVAGKRVPDDDTDGICAALRLSGLVTSTDGLLRVRNRVYARVFDGTWVRNNLPDAEVRRQRAAVGRARSQVASVAAVIIFLMGLVLYGAYRQQRSAKTTNDLILRAAAADREAKAVEDRDLRAAKAAAETANAAVKDKSAAIIALKSAIEAKEAAIVRAMQQESRADRSADVARRSAVLASKQAAIARAADAASAHLGYVTKINLAAKNIEAGQYGVAARLLSKVSDVPQAEKGFEWAYVQEQLHPELMTLGGSGPPALSAVYTSDGKSIVAVIGGQLSVYDANRAVKTRSVGEPGQFLSASLSSDGRRLAAASGRTAAAVLDTATGAQVGRLAEARDEMAPLAISPDGKRVITTSFGRMKVWNATTGEQLFVLGASQTRAVCSWNEVKDLAAFSPDGSRIVTSGLDGVLVWDGINGRRRVSLEDDARINALAFSPNGQLIASGCGDHTVRLCDASTGKTTRILTGPAGPVTSVAFSPASTRIVAGSGDHHAYEFSVDGGWELSLNGHSGAVNSVAYSPNGKCIATASQDGTLRVWDAESSRETIRLQSAEFNCNKIALSGDGTHMVCSSVDGSLAVWDIEIDRIMRIIPSDGERIDDLAFTANGTRIITGCGDDGTARLWDVSTGKLLAIRRGYVAPISGDVRRWHESWIARPERDSGGRQRQGRISTQTVSKSSATLPLDFWGMPNGGGLVGPGGFDRFSGALGVSRDRKLAIVPGVDNTLEIIDYGSGQGHRELMGHTALVASAQFSPDGKRIVTASPDDGTARVWDTATGNELVTLRAPNGLRTAIFSPNGAAILTGGNDGVTIWRRPTEKQLPAIEKANAAARTRELRSAPSATRSTGAPEATVTTPAKRTRFACVLNALARHVAISAQLFSTKEAVTTAYTSPTFAAGVTYKEDRGVGCNLVVTRFTWCDSAAPAGVRT